MSTGTRTAPPAPASRVCTAGVRVHKAAGGKVTLTDGPFTEPKEVLSGYVLFNVASKEEAVAYTQRFLDHVVQGTWETYRLFEMPAEEYPRLQRMRPLFRPSI